MHPDLPADAQFSDDLGEETSPALQWLDEVHREIRAPDRQCDARQARAGTNVDDAGLRRNQFRDNRAIEQVTRPDAAGLARSEQPAGHADPGEQIGVAPGQRQPGSEHQRSDRRLGLRFRC